VKKENDSIRNNCRIALIVSVAVFLFAGCSAITGCLTLNQSSVCPYFIDNAHVELGEKKDEYRWAGACITVCNKTNKPIEKCTVSFFVYNSDGTIPFIGTNRIKTSYKNEIAPGDSADIIISLDPYMSCIPAEPYKLDFVYAEKIMYTDGSSWSDPFGMFAQSESEGD
jgi:hypothetical protein